MSVFLERHFCFPRTAGLSLSFPSVPVQSPHDLHFTPSDPSTAPPPSLLPLQPAPCHSVPVVLMQPLQHVVCGFGSNLLSQVRAWLSFSSAPVQSWTYSTPSDPIPTPHSPPPPPNVSTLDPTPITSSSLHDSAGNSGSSEVVSQSQRRNRAPRPPQPGRCSIDSIHHLPSGKRSATRATPFAVINPDRQKHAGCGCTKTARSVGHE